MNQTFSRTGLGRVVVTFTLLSLFVHFVNCASYRWKPVAITDLSLEEENIAGRVIRLSSDEGDVELTLSSIEFPWVRGRAMSGDGFVEVDLDRTTRIAMHTGEQRMRVVPRATLKGEMQLVDGKSVDFKTDSGVVTLREIRSIGDRWVTGRLAGGDGPIRVSLEGISKIEVRELDRPMTVLKSAGVAGGIVAAGIILLALTKESCPFVYVDRGEGWEFVGEAYAGAAFRSTQRDDMMPLPHPRDAERIRVRLRNEAREIQYTDRAELIVVDHPATVRALATWDARIVLVGEPGVADSVRERDRVVTALVSTRDDRLWETTPDSLALMEGDLKDELVARFPARSEGTPVLELVAANTPWLDLVIGRFFAAMGDRLPIFLAKGNDPGARAGIERWREREGVDLAVDVRTGAGEWRRVALMPTVGAAALREIAIPLPSHVSDPLEVRFGAGAGFWQVDHLALSVAAEVGSTTHRIGPSAVVAEGRPDAAAAIAETDARYDALDEMNESLDLEFHLPPRAPGLSRSVFLSTSGYYNVHLPVQARWRPGTLKVLRDEPGALSRFGRDLARDYLRRQTATRESRSPEAAR